jgi:hypothetical protein
MPNPTIVTASLDDKELRDSITKLVNDYKLNLEDMKSATTQAVNAMTQTIKSLGNIKIDMTGTLDGLEKAKKKLSGGTTSGTTSSTSSSTANATAPNTIGSLKEEIQLQQKKVDEQVRGTKEAQYEVNVHRELQRQLKEETKSELAKSEARAKHDLKFATTLPMNDLRQAEYRLRELTRVSKTWEGKGILDGSQWNRLNNAIDKTKKKIEQLKAAQPQSLKQVLGMDASSLDAIQAKMKAIANFRLRVNADAHPQLMQRLNREYDELHKKQLRLMGQNASLARSNRTLASTFGYIRNRLIYAFTLGALANFVKDIRDIRAEYEMLDRSLGILVGDFEKGTAIFNELNQMALKSPFTLIELGTAAKQLTAYNFAASEVVDTTRRLADISAALGVPMERLTYNLGQIKAQGVLTARDARDFANAGLAIVPMLAQLYNNEKTFGDQLITTANVYDMMTKKMVTYSDVLKVIQNVTNEGGKFFDFQARQADTLKVQIANLSLAYNNMLNDIGSENQGILTGSIKLVKSLFENWRQVSRVLLTVITTLGVYRGISATVAALNSRMFVGGILVNLRNYIRGIKAATGAMATFNAVTKGNPIGMLIGLLTAAISYFVLFKNTVKDASEEVEMFGESAAKSIGKVKTLQKILKGTDDTSNTYKKTLSELSEIAKEYGVQIDAEKASRDEANKSAERTIELIKEESAERQRANQLEKARERYEAQTGEVKSDFTGALKGLEGWFGTTSATRKELIDNAEAISDVTSSIIEENIQLVVGKTGDEALKGIQEIKSKISDGLQRMGISSESIAFLFNRADIRGDLLDLINGYKNAAEEQENYNQKVENYYQAAKKATSSTMSFSQKLEANQRALQNTAGDALQLYNRIYDIVDIAKKNHVINFDLQLTAQQPPKWMFDKSLPELQRLAIMFASIAKSGRRAKGYTTEETYERSLQYAAAARRMQEEEERKARMKDTTPKTKKSGSGKGSGRQKDELLEAIKQEISLSKELQGEYEKLVDSAENYNVALEKVRSSFKNTIDLLNKDLAKFNLPQFDTNIITGKNPNVQLKYFQDLRKLLQDKGLLNLERAKALDLHIEKLNVSASKYNLDVITKGLKASFDNLEKEYELSLELDANPEFGDMFTGIFNIPTDNLPKNFKEFYDRANAEAEKALKEIGVDTDYNIFDILGTRITGEGGYAEQIGRSEESLKTLIDIQEKFRKIFKDIVIATEKDLDDYIKKYGDYSDKIAEIEAERLKKLKNLKNRYSIENRNTPEYRAQLEAIEQGASREAATAEFEAFKNSRFYEEMFENIEYASTASLKAIVGRLNELKGSLKDLSPEQMKYIVQQTEKINTELLKRNPFKGLANNVKGYIEALKKGGTAQKDFLAAQKNYKEQEKIVTALKTIRKLKLDGQKLDEANIKHVAKMSGLSENEINTAIREEGIEEASTKELDEQVEAAQAFLAVLKEILDAADKENQRFNLAKKLLKEQAAQIVNVVGSNLQSLGELKSFLTEDLGVDIGAEMEGMFDGLQKTGQGMQSIVSSLTSGNVVGALVGVGQTFYGIYDSIASIFGGGSAKNKRIDRQIKDSEMQVKRLENAYKNLEFTVEQAYGTMAVGARQAAIANKELQLAELKRQLALEKSRDSKHRDEQRILDLRGQIIDLKNEIIKSYQEIATDLLGISSVADAAESMMDAYIAALRSGEDAMESFEGSVKDMVANIIKKLFVTKVIAPELERLVDDMNERITNRSSKEAKAYEEAVRKQSENEEGWSDDDLRAGYELGKRLGWFKEYETAEDYINAIRQPYEDAVKQAKRELDKATTPTMEDIEMVAEGAYAMIPALEGWTDNLNAMLEHFDLIDKNLDKTGNLSALQQGLQSMSEDTANALEAYANSISQQAYLRNDLLTQIRDAVIGMDIDVQTATQAQMLLQLQQSYQVQMSIESILQGVLVPSGRAFAVELLS